MKSKRASFKDNFSNNSDNDTFVNILKSKEFD